MATTHELVAEMQGLYGPFTIAERVVQKIWLRRDFEQGGLRLLDGRALVIRAPGAWNLLGGPDFREARFAIEGAPVTGDVEVHFHSADWHAHGHRADRAYDGVALHVVMFPPGPGERRAVNHAGNEIPTLVLLPLLHRAMEEYVSDEALERITEQDAAEKVSRLAAMPPATVRTALRQHAEARWRTKVRFAKLRIAKLGWSEAAHHAALEILGYRRNRAPMLALAAMHPLVEWQRGIAVESLLVEQEGRWQLQGMRPANHPLYRLRQYRSWVAARPQWPATLQQTGPLNVSDELLDKPTPIVRVAIGLPGLREEWSTRIAAGSVRGSRFDTLVCDGLLPLIAADGGIDPLPIWFHWYLGDMPDSIRRALGILGLGGTPPLPFCHGWAQGLLGWLAEQDASASR